MKKLKHKEIKNMRSEIEVQLRQILSKQLEPSIRLEIENIIQGIENTKVDTNEKRFKLRMRELEEKMRKKLLKAETEMKRQLQADFDIKLQMALEQREKDVIIKCKKQLEQEKLKVTKKLNEQFKNDTENEWNKIIGEKAEISRQKSAHSIRLSNFLKQNSHSLEKRAKMGLIQSVCKDKT